MRIWSFVAGAVVAVSALALAGFVYFYFGMAPVATAAEPMIFEHRLARAALKARIHREMPTSPPPIAADEANLAVGADLYQKNCAVCHGSPDKPPTNIVRGMFPQPPQLFVKTVKDDPPGEIYWKTKNGIRLTGMPAFNGSFTETELWQVTLLLKHVDDLPGSVQKLLASK